jgi:hypothetical protein
MRQPKRATDFIEQTTFRILMALFGVLVFNSSGFSQSPCPPAIPVLPLEASKTTACAGDTIKFDPVFNTQGYSSTNYSYQLFINGTLAADGGPVFPVDHQVN